MADEEVKHLETRMFSQEEALLRLGTFMGDFSEMVLSHELHSALFVATIRTAATDTENAGILARSATYGCTPHNLEFLAASLTDGLSLGDLFYFVQQINSLAAKRQYTETLKAVNATTAETPAAADQQKTPRPTPEQMAEASQFLDKVEAEQTQRAADKLLGTPLPTGANKWKN